MSFEDRFHASVAEFIDGRPLKRYNWEAGDEGVVETDEVFSVEQDTESSGYCETCWYDEIVLRIGYNERGTGRSRTYTYYGNMAELIAELE